MEGTASEIEMPSNAHLLFTHYSDIDERYQGNYRTDHHWNIRGATKAYKQIMSALGWEEIDLSQADLSVVAELVGSMSRLGRFPLKEEAYAYTPPAGSDDDLIESLHNPNYPNESEFAQLYDFYTRYFGGLGEVTQSTGEHNILFVTDSFGTGIQRLILPSAANFYRDLTLYTHVYNSTSLSEAKSSLGIDTVIFMAGAGDYVDFAKRNPAFFD